MGKLIYVFIIFLFQLFIYDVHLCETNQIFLCMGMIPRMRQTNQTHMHQLIQQVTKKFTQFTDRKKNHISKYTRLALVTF